MDITSDGLGFMLASAVPIEAFIYTFQARYLVFRQVELGALYTIGILLFNFLGYHIFRSANGQKNDFRNGSNRKRELIYGPPKNAFPTHLHNL